MPGKELTAAENARGLSSRGAIARVRQDSVFAADATVALTPVEGIAGRSSAVYTRGRAANLTVAGRYAACGTPQAT